MFLDFEAMRVLRDTNTTHNVRPGSSGRKLSAVDWFVCNPKSPTLDNFLFLRSLTPNLLTLFTHPPTSTVFPSLLPLSLFLQLASFTLSGL